MAQVSAVSGLDGSCISNGISLNLWKILLISSVNSVDTVDKQKEDAENAERNPHGCAHRNVHNHVDNVDNYIPRIVSPTFTISPAPIVITRSPG